MGRRVRAAGGQEPEKWVYQPCPCCGGTRTVINGAWLKYRREWCGIDQRSFGWSVRASGPYISDIERNRRDCPADIHLAYERLRLGLPLRRAPARARKRSA